MKLFRETSSFFHLVENIQNEAVLQDFLIFRSWQYQKRSNSARLPSKWKVECRADGLVPMRFAFFPLHLSKVLRLPRKIDARSYEVLHLSRKIILANTKIWCSKMQPLSGNQRADILTSLMNMSLVRRLPRKMHLCRSSSNVPRLPSFLEMLQNLHVLLTFEKLHNPLRLPRETTSEPPKVARTCSIFCILTSKCASRHNGVHFFDISTSKSGPTMVCFVHFDLDMCLAPQRRALFRQLNFQKWSDNGVLSPFWLPNVLRATTACTFSTPQLPKVFRLWGIFSIRTSKCASRHNGVQFFISHQTRSLRTHRPAALASLLFDPPEPQNNGKTQRFATFLPFRAPASSFFWLCLFSDLFSSSFLFSDSSSHFCFFEVCKLPSISELD